MTKTKQQNARRNAKAIAKERGLTYQQALDEVAKESGYAHWSAMKASFSASASMMEILRPAIDYAWNRRSDSMNLIMDETGSTLIVNTDNRMTFGLSLDARGTKELKKQVAKTYGIDIDGEIDESWSATCPVTLSGREYHLPIRIIAKDEKRELVIQMPGFEERTSGENPLDHATMSKVRGLLYHCDHGLTIICGGTPSQRKSAAEHLVKASSVVGNIGIYGENQIDRALNHSQGWHAILLSEKSRIFDVKNDLDTRGQEIRYIAGVELDVKPARIFLFEERYPSRPDDSYGGYVSELN